MPERVRITDVSPRDGLQNEAGVIATADKAKLVELLCGTGVDEVEVTSFVSAKWVPQLGDAAELVSGLTREFIRTRRFQEGRYPALSVLIPNERGLETWLSTDAPWHQVAIDVRDDECPPQRLIEKIALFTAASETFSQKNTNATIAETLERFRPVLKRIEQDNVAVRGYISCAIACPFEGPISPFRVADVASRLIDLGVGEIDVGDTIGAGTPETVEKMLEVVLDRIGSSWGSRGTLTLHLHDTFGRAAECVRTALDVGVRSFDGSVAGLGGCPYASTPGKRVPGNIATETLVRTVHGAGYETGVDLEALEKAAVFAREIVAKSRAGAAS